MRHELAGLRASVRSVRGCLVATSDGLLVAADVPGDEPEQIAALAATLVGLARYSVAVARAGTLVEAVVGGTEGYVVAFALGDAAVMAVLGEADLDVAVLRARARPIVDRLAGLAGRFAGFVTPAEAGGRIAAEREHLPGRHPS